MLAHAFALHAKVAWRIGPGPREARLSGTGDAEAAHRAIDEAPGALPIDLGVRL